MGIFRNIDREFSIDPDHEGFLSFEDKEIAEAEYKESWRNGDVLFVALVEGAPIGASIGVFVSGICCVPWGVMIIVTIISGILGGLVGYKVADRMLGINGL